MKKKTPCICPHLTHGIPFSLLISATCYSLLIFDLIWFTVFPFHFLLISSHWSHLTLVFPLVHSFGSMLFPYLTRCKTRSFYQILPRPAHTHPSTQYTHLWIHNVPIPSFVSYSPTSTKPHTRMLASLSFQCLFTMIVQANLIFVAGILQSGDAWFRSERALPPGTERKVLMSQMLVGKSKNWSQFTF